MKIEDKILKILSEEVPYEVVGGPTPSEVLKNALDYTKPVTPATVPQAKPIPGVGETGTSDAADAEEITDVVDDLNEDESDEDKAEDEKDEKEGKEDSLEETFASLLRRLAEEDEDESDEDKKKDLDEEDDAVNEDEVEGTGAPKEILPDVEQRDDLAAAAPGAKVAECAGKVKGQKLAEDEVEGTGAPKETLPDVEPQDDLATPAPGVKIAEDEEAEDKKDKKEDEQVSEDVRAIFAGHKLSESAKSKAEMVFKAAVARRVSEERTRVAKKATSKLTEAFAALKAESAKKQVAFEAKLSADVDKYLNYVVENWMVENRLAVERGIRSELAEGFIAGLKKLFVEHYIEIPESKVDVVKTLGNKVSKLEGKLNEALENNIQMRASLNGYRKEEVVRAVGAGLSDTQRDKLAKLAEGVEYTTRKEFAVKLSSLKESYFPKVAAPKKEEPLMEQKAPLSPEMAAIEEVLSKLSKQ